MSATLETNPNLDESLFDVPTVDKLSEAEQLQHKPRILLL
ncbi:MAG TPA: arsenical resistance protein ArsH, partial [Pseudomonas sp.]|nr:arsenical resistance protein ArsH [Pseudomonas sp.]